MPAAKGCVGPPTRGLRGDQLYSQGGRTHTGRSRRSRGHNNPHCFWQLSLASSSWREVLGVLTREVDRFSFSVCLSFPPLPPSRPCTRTDLSIMRHMIGHHCPSIHSDPEQRTRRSTVCHGVLLSSGLFALSASAACIAQTSTLDILDLNLFLSLSFALSLVLTVSLRARSPLFSLPPLFLSGSRFSQHLARRDLLRASRSTTVDNDDDDDDSIKPSRLNAIITNSLGPRSDSNERTFARVAGFRQSARTNSPFLGARDKRDFGTRPTYMGEA